MIKFLLAIAAVVAIAGCTSNAVHQQRMSSTLLEHLNKYKTYPIGPRLAGIQGINRLRFVIDANGNVVTYELVQSSGNADLDKATLDMIRRAQPLPKPPAELMENGQIEIVAPFVYSLTRPI